MRANPWGKFYWADHASDHGLALCSLAAQGLWMRMLCIAAAHQPVGYVAINGRGLATAELAKSAGIDEATAAALLGELEGNGVFSRDRRSCIYSRRMVRDAKKAEAARRNGRAGGNPSLRNRSHISTSDNPPDKVDLKAQKPEARGQSLASLDDAFDGFNEEQALRQARADRGKPRPAASHERCSEVAERLSGICDFIVPPPDGHFVNEWLTDGADPEKVIFPIAEDAASKLRRRGQKIHTFKYLDIRIREAMASQQASTDNTVNLALRRLPAGPNPHWEAKQREIAAQ